MAYRKLFAFGDLIQITQDSRVHGKTLIQSRNRKEGILSKKDDVSPETNQL